MGNHARPCPVLGIVITGLVYMVHPDTGKEVAKRGAKVVLVVFAIHEALSYLWSGWTGRLVLIAAGILILGALGKGRKGAL
ncbi:MAG TPA: hypothetical protein VKX49_06610 [Bryobacteraceae bacterium]|nr:hypothetical protein [Bryobacteraceae bacterium]